MTDLLTHPAILFSIGAAITAGAAIYLLYRTTAAVNRQNAERLAAAQRHTREHGQPMRPVGASQLVEEQRMIDSLQRANRLITHGNLPDLDHRRRHDPGTIPRPASRVGAELNAAMERFILRFDEQFNENERRIQELTDRLTRTEAAYRDLTDQAAAHLDRLEVAYVDPMFLALQRSPNLAYNRHQLAQAGRLDPESSEFNKRLMDGLGHGIIRVVNGGAETRYEIVPREQRRVAASNHHPDGELDTLNLPKVETP